MEFVKTKYIRNRFRFLMEESFSQSLVVQKSEPFMRIVPCNVKYILEEIWFCKIWKKFKSQLWKIRFCTKIDVFELSAVFPIFVWHENKRAKTAGLFVS